MRALPELIQLSIEEGEKPYIADKYSGLCRHIVKMKYHGVITDEEHRRLKRLIVEFLRSNMIAHGDRDARMSWLKQQLGK